MPKLTTVLLSPYRRNPDLESIDESITTSGYIIGQIFPKELLHNNLGYIFFHFDDSSEILAVVLPLRISREEPNKTLRILDEMIWKVKEKIIKEENLVDAYDMLVLERNENRNDIYRVQLLKLMQDWKKVIESEKFQRRRGTKAHENSINLLREITSNLDEARKELFLTKENANSQLDIVTAEAKFENKALNELNFFLEEIGHVSYDENYLPFKHLENCLEKETIVFLKSVLRAEKFILERSSSLSRRRMNFDFTCIGVPLWKAIELELNESIIKLLRYKFNIIDLSNPKINIFPTGGIINIKGTQNAKITLNRVDKETSKLESFTIGTLMKIIANSHKNYLKEALNIENFSIDIINFVTDKQDTSLSKQLSLIHHIRNPHSHVKSMSKDIYRNLRSYVIEPPLTPNKSTLGKIAKIKCEMQKKYKI